MRGTTERLLKLLSLLQARQEWTGPDLATRLDVSERTVRNDIDRLRDLGYPVEARRGSIGGYRLGAGAEMPPLLLDDEEAVAIAVSLTTATSRGITGLEEAGQRAMGKLQQVLPNRLRRRVAALQEATSTVEIAPPAATTDPAMLQELATATHRHECMQLTYTSHGGEGSRRLVEPTRLVNWGVRWYLLAWDRDRDDWRTFRVDRIARADPTGMLFAERELPAEDMTTWISDNVARAGWDHVATILIQAPAASIVALIPSQMGSVEAVNADQCRLHTGSNDLGAIAMWLTTIESDFTVESPAALADLVDTIGQRFRRAVKAG